MATNWRTVIGTALQVAAQALLASKPATPFLAPSTSKSPEAVTFGNITAVGLNAFVQMASPLVRIVEGQGTILDDEAAANAVADAVALFDPSIQPIVAIAEAAEPFANFFISGLKSGQIQGGFRPVLTGYGGSRGGRS